MEYENIAHLCFSYVNTDIKTWQGKNKHFEKKLTKLIQIGFDINQDSEVGTPLIVACELGYLWMVKTLVKYGADPYQFCNSLQATPIGMIAYTGKTKILSFFSKKFSLELPLKENETKNPRFVGTTLLHRVMGKYYSSQENKYKIIKIIVDNMNNPLAKTVLGETAFDFGNEEDYLILKKAISEKNKIMLDTFLGKNIKHKDTTI